MTMGQVEATFTADGTGAVRWVVQGATVRRSLNEPYRVDLDVQTDAAETDPLQMLGHGCELVFERGEQQRSISGIVSSVRASHPDPQIIGATLTFEPALAALRHIRDTRIFQGLTVPQILEQVLGEDLGSFGRSVSVEVQRSYPVREYTVQYKETSFDFVHRLMEEEGIVYFFEHEGGPETLVLIDALAQHPMLEGLQGAMLEFSNIEGEFVDTAREAVNSFVPRTQMRSTQAATRHFNWTRPSSPIQAEEAGGGGGEHPDGSADGPLRESYEHDEQLTLHSYGGAYQANDSADQVRIRRELQRRDAELCEGRASSISLAPGRRFTLNGHPRLDLNRDYILVGTTDYYLGHVPAQEDAAGRYRHDQRFTCMPADRPWRPARLRSRPRIHGIQTAIVVGPGGEEIFTDEHGRIKVQFHWDREGQNDQQSSCFIRVMQTWAGPGWGTLFLPRIGMEVVVSFIDGDADQPVVTGCLYNGDNPPPYSLPAERTKSTIKSNSSLGGGGFNEFRFEDMKGSEEIWLHGEKDWNTLIKNDLSRQVGHDETQAVANDRTRTVGNNESLAVSNNRTRTVGVDESVTVGSNRSKAIGQNESITVGLNLTRAVGVNESVTIGAMRSHMVGANASLIVGANREVMVAANQSFQVGVNDSSKIGGNSSRKVKGNDSLTVTGDRSHTVSSNESISVSSDQSISVGANQSLSVGSDQSASVGAKQSLSVGSDRSVSVGSNQSTDIGSKYNLSVASDWITSVGGKMSIDVDNKLSITVGSGSVTIDKSGKIQIKGSKLDIKASGNITVKGTKTGIN